MTPLEQQAVMFWQAEQRDGVDNSGAALECLLNRARQFALDAAARSAVAAANPSASTTAEGGKRALALLFDLLREHEAGSLYWDGSCPKLAVNMFADVANLLAEIDRRAMRGTVSASQSEPPAASDVASTARDALTPGQQGMLDQIESAKRSVASWPKWMQDAAYFSTASLPSFAPAASHVSTPAAPPEASTQPVPQASADPEVCAQHDETGRLWAGPRSQIPRRFAECPEPPGQRVADAQPTVPPDYTAWVNALPEPYRTYITHMETVCDPAGDVRMNVYLREQNKALAQRVADASAQPDELASLRELAGLATDLVRLRRDWMANGDGSNFAELDATFHAIAKWVYSWTHQDAGASPSSSQSTVAGKA